MSSIQTEFVWILYEEWLNWFNVFRNKGLSYFDGSLPSAPMAHSYHLTQVATAVCLPTICFLFFICRAIKKMWVFDHFRFLLLRLCDLSAMFAVEDIGLLSCSSTDAEISFEQDFFLRYTAKGENQYSSLSVFNLFL